jgi:hypothetical protein
MAVSHFLVEQMQAYTVVCKIHRAVRVFPRAMPAGGAGRL